MSGQTQKEIALTAFALAVSVGTFSLFALAAAEAPSLMVLAVASAAALIWAAVLALAFALVGSISAAILMWGIPIMVIIAGGMSSGVFAAALPIVAALAMARWRIREQISDTIGFRPARIFYGGLRWVLLGILVAATGLAVAPVRTTMRTADIAIPEEFIAITLSPIEPLLAGTIPVGAPPLIPLMTGIVNSYINTVLHNSPLLSAFAAAVAVLFVSRLVVSLTAWPSLALVLVFVLLARQTRLVYLVTEQVESSRLELEENEHG